MTTMSERSLLDRLLPTFDEHNRHATVIHASPAQVHEALWAVTAGEMPLFVILIAMRALPARLTMRSGPSRDLHRPLLPSFLAHHFTLLADVPGTEIAIGLISQPWRLRGGAIHPIVDASDFIAFTEPGFAKVVMTFSLRPADGGTRLATETRILATDVDARTRFQRYWNIVRVGSGIIRWDWLRAVKRRAERPT